MTRISLMDDDELICIMCGCSDDHPSPRGCRRAEPILCSRCADELDPM